MSLSTFTHFVATLLSIAGLAVLVTLAALHATALHVVSFSIFGAALILLYLASTLYHLIPRRHGAKKVFRLIDHSMIYVLIAGTYTPVVLLVLPPGWGWSMFGIIWGLAVLGILMKTTFARIPGLVWSLFYLLMGWLVVIAFLPLRATLSWESLWWLIGGGIFYTGGTLFFALDKFFPRTSWWTYHDIFHVFVMLGSLAHFWFMFRFVLPT